jgi:hypothetical protein
MVSCSCFYAADEEFPSISWCIYGLSLLMCVLVTPICMYYCWSRSSICGVEVSSVSAASVVCSFVYDFCVNFDRLCGLVVRVLGYRSGGPGQIPGTTNKKVVGLERGPLSLVSTTEELLDRKVAVPV